MFVDFVNSLWYDGSGNADDRLTRPEFLPAFVDKWLSGGEACATGDADARCEPLGLRAAPSTRHADLEADDLGLLRRLRDVLRDVVETIAAGGPLPPALVERLDRFLEGDRIWYRLSGDSNGVSLHVLADPNDAPAIASAVALSAAEFLARGDLTRLKQCDNDGCRWVFYDTTKNDSRRWCDSRQCGNVDKVRRYRARHSGPAPSP